MSKSTAHIATANYTSVTKRYFSEVALPAFRLIEKKIKPIERYYVIAGKLLCLKFYNKTLLEKLTPALAHNEVAPAGSVDLTLSFFDSAHSGVTFVSPWKSEAHNVDAVTNVRQESESDFIGAYIRGMEAMPLYDRKTKHAYFWTCDAEQLPAWVSAAPIRTILHWFLSESQIHLLHGAVVGVGDKAILLTAKGGSGKSTTALACLLEGMKYMADDYVAIELADPIVAHSLYNSVKVAPSRISASSALYPHVWGTEGEKSIIFLADVFPDRLYTSVPLKAIMIPVIAHQSKTAIMPASKMETMLALLPTTLMQLPLADSNKPTLLAEIIRKTPCYFVHLSENSQEVAQTIKHFVEEL